MQAEYGYTIAGEQELGDLLAGRGVEIIPPWDLRERGRLPAGATGVVCRKGSELGDPVQPVVLVAHEEEFRRLCGRFAHLRSDLSPLTAWCHLLTPKLLESIESLTRVPDLRGLQAAWTGLVVAEGQLLAEKPLASLRISACLATESFAIARAKALWNHIPTSDIINRFDAVNRLFRSERAVQGSPFRTRVVRSALQPISACLTALPTAESAPISSELRPIVASLRALQNARSEKDPEEARRFAEPLLESVTFAKELFQLRGLTPELRLQVFDKLIDSLDTINGERETLRRNALAMLAGYLATVAAGGVPSLSLAENIAHRWPEVTAWAYVVGGIGERVVWTSSFDGLGRLVAREMMRPLRLEEPPTCDFALDEAAVLVDPTLPDPLVHLRIKQAKIATVAILPGVNVLVSIGDSAAQERGRPEHARLTRQAEPPVATQTSRDPLAVLADAIWPHLRARVEDYIRSAQGSDATLRDSDSQPTRGKRRPNSQSQLPLTDPKK